MNPTNANQTQMEPTAPRWTIRYELTDSLHTSAVRAYWFRTHGPRMILVNIILVGYLAALWFFGRIPEYRLALTIAVGCVILYSFLTHVRFFVQRRHDLQRLPHRETTLRLSEECLYVERADNAMPIPWHTILRIIKRNRFWLLKYGIEQLVIIPLDKTRPEALAFIEQRISGAGGGHDDGCPTCYASFRPPQEPVTSDSTPTPPDCSRHIDESPPADPSDCNDATLPLAANTTDRFLLAAYKRHWYHDWPQFAVVSILKRRRPFSFIRVARLVARFVNCWLGSFYLVPNASISSGLPIDT